MLRTQWLFKEQGYSDKHNDFLKFLDNLNQANIEALYTTPLIDSLLKPMYKLREYIILLVFIPFVIQSVIVVLYFSTRLQEDLPLEYGAMNYVCEILILLLTCYFIFHEVLQTIPIGGSIRDVQYKYLFSLTNVSELLSYGLNLFLVFNEWSGRKLSDNKRLKLYTLVAIGLVWFKAFYWMRLFAEHAFFINLLK